MGKILIIFSLLLCFNNNLFSKEVDLNIYTKKVNDCLLQFSLLKYQDTNKQFNTKHRSIFGLFLEKDLKREFKKFCNEDMNILATMLNFHKEKMKKEDIQIAYKNVFTNYYNVLIFYLGGIYFSNNKI